MTYYQQMLQKFDIHTEEGRGGETEAQGHRLYIFFYKKKLKMDHRLKWKMVKV